MMIDNVKSKRNLFDTKIDFFIPNLFSWHVIHHTTMAPKTVFRKLDAYDEIALGFRQSYESVPEHRRDVTETKSATYRNVFVTCQKCSTQHQVFGWLMNAIINGERDKVLYSNACHKCRADMQYMLDNPQEEVQAAIEHFTYPNKFDPETTWFNQVAFDRWMEKFNTSQEWRRTQLERGQKFSQMVELPENVPERLSKKSFQKK
jgi:hypothetical protein